MLRVPSRFVREARAAGTARALFPLLQRAIEVEHSTIPPYLTAWYSLKPGLNDGIGEIFRSIVIEEMLHMTISANILVSLGGHPAIANTNFVPTYPGNLPMGIGGPGLVIHIAPFSLALVRDTFMAIEQPEAPVPVEDGAGDDLDNDVSYRTIGEFYDALKQALRRLPDSAFGHVDRQVLGVWPDTLNFAIQSAEDACRAIDIIVSQGEGSSTDPFEGGRPAHYYRFGEVLYGAGLVPIEPVKGGPSYAYGGTPIAFVPTEVFPMRPDPGPLQFAEGTYGRLMSDTFSEAYSTLLRSLHAAFNGHPERIRESMGLMYQLRFLAQKLMATPLVPGQVATAGPVFRYVG